VLSEKTTSDPSPHLILIEDAGVTFMADDFEEVPKKIINVVPKLAIKRVIAIAIFMRLISLQKSKL
jgi:hypothetical protein